MIAEHLRKSVLQQAVMGKLVPQYEDDETVLELIEKVNKENKSIKSRNVYQVNEIEVPFEIPNTWRWVRLYDILLDMPKNGYSPKAVTYKTSVKNLALTATTSGYFKKEAYKFIDEKISDDSYLWLKNGDLLIQRSNSIDYVGTSCIYTGADNEYIYPDLIMKIKLSSFIYTKYIDYVLKSNFVREYFRKNAKGTSKSMPKINQNTVINCLIPLPPASEQKRIVYKIEEIMKKVNELNTIESILKDLKDKFLADLKSSILQYSMQGKLVEEDKDDTPVDLLINKIYREKKQLVKEKKIKKEKTLLKINDDEIPFEIPGNWVWERLGNCAVMYTGNSIPQTVKKNKYTGLSEGYNYIGTKDIGFDNKIDYENGIKIPFDEPKFKYAYSGDILLCIEGGSAGRKIAITNETVCFGNKLCKFHALQINNRFLYYYLQSNCFISVFKNNITGIIGGVSITKLKNLLIPLPPIEEQERIVEKLDEVLPLCENLNED